MDRPDQQPNKFHTTGGGLLRYSYCDPAFILGTPMAEARPLADWVAISSQSRWQGVIFAGEHDPRIVPVPRAVDNRVAFNQFWSVQSKGSLVTQKLRTSKGTAEMMVWISKNGLGQPVEEDNIVFVEAPGAYAAMRVARGSYTLEERVFKGIREEGNAFTTPAGYIVKLADEYAPLILEVMSRSKVKSFADFKAKVKASPLNMNGPVLHYRSIYGDLMTLDTSYQDTPTINGKPVNYAPGKVYDSPFLQADYNSGVVTIRKGHRQKVLDFRP
jgi:hypothetical protein